VISKTLLEMVKRYESFSAQPYRCPAGVWTIGYGETQGVTRTSAPVTREAAEQHLIRRLSEFQEQVRALVTGHVPTQNELDAMTSLAYNIGVGAFAKSSVRRFFNAGRTLDAANAFRLWNKATVNGKRVVLRGLTRRREEERTLFLTRDTTPVVRSA
jgi:lysozyme